MSLRFMPRLLDLFAPRERWESSGLGAFRSLLLLHALVRTLDWLPASMPGGAAGPWIILGMRIVLVITAVASLWPRLARLAAVLAALVVSCQVILAFPEVEDHIYLELFALVLFALLDPRGANDGPLLRSTLCWMGAIVLFHSGLQKLLHGYYFFAEFPLWAIATKDPVGALFGWLVSTTEVTRLQSLNLLLPDSGPFLTNSVPLIFVANAIWALEIELAVMVLIPSTRRLAAITAIVAVVVVQVVGHQPIFALLLAQFFVLCIPGQWNRRLALLFVAAYAALLLMHFGVLPDTLLLRETPL